MMLLLPPSLDTDEKTDAHHGWVPGTGKNRENRAQGEGIKRTHTKPHFMFESMGLDEGE